jgi:hypothetical protein
MFLQGLKETHRLHVEGLSFEAIAREWNVEELPTLSQKGHWHGKTILRLVQSALRPLQAGSEALSRGYTWEEST